MTRDGSRGHVDAGAPDATPPRRAIDEVAALREELAATRAELAAALKVKDEFLSIMSHELRTPLNGVLGLSEALEEEVYGALDARQREVVRRIAASGRRLLALVDDILDVADADTGKVVLDLSAVDAAEICRQSYQRALDAAAKRRQRPHLDLPPGPLPIQADGRRLGQILDHLLENAIKFTPEGGSFGLSASVEMGPRAAPNPAPPASAPVTMGPRAAPNPAPPPSALGTKGPASIRINVWDTGIGIADGDRSTLFEPFGQIDRRLSRRGSGAGLGLTLVRRFVELHGGHVELESEPGEGSCFTVVLPTVSAAPPSAATSHASGTRRRADEGAEAQGSPRSRAGDPIEPRVTPRRR